MAETSIEWATHVLNAFTGCDRVSPGCAHCYAIPAAKRLQAQEIGRAAKALREGRPEPRMNYQTDGDPRTSGPGFGFTVHWDKLHKPPRFPAGARVFVNSMSDVFHEQAPAEALRLLWLLFASRPDVVWIVLTKRSDRMRAWVPWLEHLMPEGTPWPLPNVWLVVSVENRKWVGRADDLRATPAAVRGVSAEPLLGPLRYDSHGQIGPEMATRCVPCWATGDPLAPQLDLTGIDWLIVGGESGKGHRHLNPEWMRDLRDTCEATGTLLFVKQMGGHRPGNALEDLPDDLRIRELPAPPVPLLTT
jgi:protein gp37